MRFQVAPPSSVAYSHWYIGELQRKADREADALQSLQAARTIFEKLVEANSLDLYDLACIQAISASLVGVGKADLSPQEQALRQRYADRALATLRTVTVGGYHNAEWASKMESVGLVPSTTGAPGGARVGQAVSHYVDGEGRWQRTG